MSETLPFFVEARQLHELLGAPDVQVVAVESEADFAQAHIPGALQLAKPDFTASDPPVEGLMPDTKQLAAALSDAGLRNDAHIVAYDRIGDAAAARLLYTLDVMGHGAISLLDGGLRAWHAAGYPLESGAPSASPTTFDVEPQPQGIADRDWIQAHLDDNDTCFLDVRSAPEYSGIDVRSARGGHIPGAVNLDWQQFKDANGRLRPRAELQELLVRHGIDADHDITAYCQSHTRSSYAWLVLKALGYTRVRGYPGSWSDWGNNPDTPVE